MRISLAIVAALLSGAILANNASAADPVYKWVDGSGRSHYSQSPPEGQKYQTITTAGTVANSAPIPAAGVAVSTVASSSPANSGPTPAQVERQKYCETARNNVQTLTTRPLVEMDLTGDGKPEKLTPGQQTEQLAKAQQQVQVLCAK